MYVVKAELHIFGNSKVRLMGPYRSPKEAADIAEAIRVPEGSSPLPIWSTATVCSVIPTEEIGRYVDKQVEDRIKAERRETERAETPKKAPPKRRKKATIAATVVVRMADEETYKVFAFGPGGERLPNADYEADDMYDAQSTADAMVAAYHGHPVRPVLDVEAEERRAEETLELA